MGAPPDSAKFAASSVPDQARHSTRVSQKHVAYNPTPVAVASKGEAMVITNGAVYPIDDSANSKNGGSLAATSSTRSPHARVKRKRTTAEHNAAAVEEGVVRGEDESVSGVGARGSLRANGLRLESRKTEGGRGTVSNATEQFMANEARQEDGEQAFPSGQGRRVSGGCSDGGDGNGSHGVTAGGDDGGRVRPLRSRTSADVHPQHERTVHPQRSSSGGVSASSVSNDNSNGSGEGPYAPPASLSSPHTHTGNSGAGGDPRSPLSPSYGRRSGRLSGDMGGGGAVGNVGAGGSNSNGGPNGSRKNKYNRWAHVGVVEWRDRGNLTGDSNGKSSGGLRGKGLGSSPSSAAAASAVAAAAGTSAGSTSSLPATTSFFAASVAAATAAANAAAAAFQPALAVTSNTLITPLKTTSSATREPPVLPVPTSPAAAGVVTMTPTNDVAGAPLPLGVDKHMAGGEDDKMVPPDAVVLMADSGALYDNGRSHSGGITHHGEESTPAVGGPSGAALSAGGSDGGGGGDSMSTTAVPGDPAPSSSSLPSSATRSGFVTNVRTSTTNGLKVVFRRG